MCMPGGLHLQSTRWISKLKPEAFCLTRSRLPLSAESIRAA
jgi:hypothetical protein